MFTPIENRLNAADEALDATSPCNNYAIAPCNTSNNVEKVEYVEEGKNRTALGADKSLADAERLEAIDALWRAALNSGDVLLYSGLEENLVR